MKHEVSVIIKSQDGAGNAKILIGGVPYGYKFPAGDTLSKLRKKYWNNGIFLKEIDQYCTGKIEENK